MYVLIPADYEAQGVVPIGISDVDYEGRLVAPGWIEAVKPVAGSLRRITALITGDVGNVSQLAEETVHALSADNGENLGRNPSCRIYVGVKWRARNLRDGGSRKRKRIETELLDEYIDTVQCLPEFANDLEARDLVEHLIERARQRERADLEQVIDLFLADAEREIPSVFGVRRGSPERKKLSVRLYRGLRKLLASL